jgi:hypothetical protein
MSKLSLADLLAEAIDKESKGDKNAFADLQAELNRLNEELGCVSAIHIRIRPYAGELICLSRMRKAAENLDESLDSVAAFCHLVVEAGLSTDHLRAIAKLPSGTKLCEKHIGYAICEPGDNADVINDFFLGINPDLRALISCLSEPFSKVFTEKELISVLANVFSVAGVTGQDIKEIFSGVWGLSGGKLEKVVDPDHLRRINEVPKKR